MQFTTFVHRSLQYSWSILLFFRPFLQCIKVILNSNPGRWCTCKEHQVDNKKCNKILDCNSFTFFCSRPPRRTAEAEGACPGSSSQRPFLGYMPLRNLFYKTNSTYPTAGEPLLYSFSQAIDENTEHKQPRTDLCGSPWCMLPFWQWVPDNFWVWVLNLFYTLSMVISVPWYFLCLFMRMSCKTLPKV